MRCSTTTQGRGHGLPARGSRSVAIQTRGGRVSRVCLLSHLKGCVVCRGRAASSGSTPVVRSLCSTSPRMTQQPRRLHSMCSPAAQGLADTARRVIQRTANPHLVRETRFRVYKKAPETERNACMRRHQTPALAPVRRHQGFTLDPVTPRLFIQCAPDGVASNIHPDLPPRTAGGGC